MKRSPILYPGVEEVNRELSRNYHRKTSDNIPDWKNGKPNYEKFKNWKPEEVLTWLNID